MEPATGDETMPERVYADWNATAPLRPEARDAMIAVFDAVALAIQPNGNSRDHNKE